MRAWQPEIVFHLAAQALVRRSYREPVETYATNVMGTVHVLEAVRAVPSVRAVVVVTSDKCYENREWPWAYRETEAMGGHDPYSSSKGLRRTRGRGVPAIVLLGADRAVGIATARAGNVIGGGDWAEDRLLPDCIQALAPAVPIGIRNPRGVRPWQHVLEPLCGYLLLAERLHDDPAVFGDAWNFGPAEDDAWQVGWIAHSWSKQWGEPAQLVRASTPMRRTRAASSEGRCVTRPRAAGLGASAAAERGAGLDGASGIAAWAPGEPALALTDEQLARYCG